MSDDAKKKSCKRCHKQKLLKEFPRSAFSKDGKLGYCSGCWSTKMEEASAGRARPKKVKPKKAKIGRPRGSKTKNRAPVLQAANEALKASGSIKEKFLVRANDGEVSEFTHEGKALRQAMEWKMAGFVVTVWRQCEFEMVLRIIG
jgi:hypothetical protein